MEQVAQPWANAGLNVAALLLIVQVCPPAPEGRQDAFDFKICQRVLPQLNAIEHHRVTVPAPGLKTHYKLGLSQTRRQPQST